MQPLDGVKVLDLSQVFAGPSCSQILGDLGADIYKVERIGIGDLTRQFMVAENLNGESYAYLSLNRNKRSICLDLRHPEGKEIALKLAKGCDVVLHNYRPGVAERLGLDYKMLKQHNPRIVYASASGFGPAGPYSSKPGQDLVAQGLSGASWQNGERDGPPIPMGVPIADFAAGMFLVQGILSALLLKERTGEGQEVTVSLLDAIFVPQCEPATAYLSSGHPSRKNTRPLYRAYRTKDDKWMVLAGVFRENPLRDICTLLGLPDLSKDERFNTWEKANYENACELEGILVQILMTKTRHEWIKLLEDHDAICAPLNTYEEAFSDPQVVHNRIDIELNHPRAGKVRTIGSPIKFSSTPVQYRLPPPMLGEHTDEILAMLSYSDEQIRRLRDLQVVS